MHSNADRCALFVECCPRPAVPNDDLRRLSEELLHVKDGPFRVSPLKGSATIVLQVTILEHPSLNSLREKMEQLHPDVVYCTGGYSPNRDLLNAEQSPLSFAEEASDRLPCLTPQDLTNLLEEIHIKILYIDAPLATQQGE